MMWNWQYEDWPNFRYDKEKAQELERRFLLNSGQWLGICAHLTEGDQRQLEVSLQWHLVKGFVAIRYLLEKQIRRSHTKARKHEGKKFFC